MVVAVVVGVGVGGDWSTSCHEEHKCIEETPPPTPHPIYKNSFHSRPQYLFLHFQGPKNRERFYPHPQPTNLYPLAISSWCWLLDALLVVAVEEVGASAISWAGAGDAAVAAAAAADGGSGDGGLWSVFASP